MLRDFPKVMQITNRSKSKTRFIPMSFSQIAYYWFFLKHTLPINYSQGAEFS